jgi:dTMP kinase
VSDAAPAAGTSGHGLREVLHIPAFRRLWVALSFSSLGDWLGLLATTALAQRLASDGGPAAANFAVSGVFILRLAPAVVLGPLAGAVADRLNRRWTMIVCDVARFVLFVSIPMVGKLWWLFVATFFIEVAGQFWAPAKEATVPNLVPRERLEQANQLTLVTTYGSAPVAAALFSGLALLSSALGVGFLFFRENQISLALYFNAATFLAAAVTVYRLRDIPARPVRSPLDTEIGGLWRTIVDGWAFIGHTPLVRGLVVGMLGAFAAGGAVVGLARSYVRDLGGGDPAYGVLFGAVFLGLAGGMFLGPRLLAGLSRRRLFGLALAAAGVALALLGLVPDVVLAALVTLCVGGFAGIAWVTGYTLLGLEVDDGLRGRTFAFVQSMVRIILVAVLAVAPLLAVGLRGLDIRLTDDVSITYSGAALTFLLAGVLAAGLGVASYRQMDDRPGIPLWRDLVSAWRGTPVVAEEREPSGFFVAFEGGDGVGKSTQVDLLGKWLTERGHSVVLTREPGATAAGRRIRRVLLDPVEGDGLSPRAEALLYAADRAEHVHRVIRPALQRGEIVVTDRYSDSSVAYQGAGRVLSADDVTRISRWGTDGLQPDVTILLDVPPRFALRRSAEPPDRLESEPPEFHERVRREFLSLARREPGRYLVVDGTLPRERIAQLVRERLDGVLPPSPREVEQARRHAERERDEDGLPAQVQSDAAARHAPTDHMHRKVAAEDSRDSR